jgi:hypothetical protein
MSYVNLILKTQGIPQGISESYLYNLLAPKVYEITGKRLVFLRFSGNDIILTVENPISLAAIFLLTQIIIPLLIPLGIFIVGIMIGGAIAEALKATAYIWVPVVIGIISIILYFWLRQKIKEVKV